MIDSLNEAEFNSTGTEPDGDRALPRIFCIPAAEARVAAVLENRRGGWRRLGRWNLSTGTYEAGACFRLRIYPQRCDLSPDGRWFCYFAYKSGSDWPAGETYEAISRLPWLKALAAWKEAGTWSRGLQFGSDKTIWEAGQPTVGDASNCRAKYGLKLIPPAQFAIERRRGWHESKTTPVRSESDIWDQEREIVMEKIAPVGLGHAVLTVEGKFAAYRESPHSYPPRESIYRLHRRRSSQVLSGVQWADWDVDGRLLVATWDHKLQILDVKRQMAIVKEVNLADEEPTPQPAPPWASEW